MTMTRYLNTAEYLLALACTFVAHGVMLAVVLP
jgi:hypothetical protein